MSTELATTNDSQLAALEQRVTITDSQTELIKKTIAKDATDNELQLFFYDCKRRGVHPLDKLIHFTKRGGKYTPVTSIDFMRSRAAETGEYAGNEDAVFSGEPKTDSFAASVTVSRFVQGQPRDFTATARWSEYKPDQAFMWEKMPHTMLGKCAEALALRKAFPQQLSGLYASEEMDQDGNERGSNQSRPTTPMLNMRRQSQERPAEKLPEVTEENFENVVCMYGREGGRVHGKTVGEIGHHLWEWFEEKVFSAWQDQTPPEFQPLRTAIEIALRLHRAKGSANEQKPAQEAEKPETKTNTAKPTDPTKWREYEIEAKTLACAGQKLGTLPPSDISDVERYLETVNWSKAKEPQKRLKAMMAMRAAELATSKAEPETSSAPSAPHVEQLRAKLKASNIEEGAFLAEMHEVAAIAGDTMESITEEEAKPLLANWQGVVEQLDKIPS